MPKLTTISVAYWQAEPPKLMLTLDETDDIRGRRYRAKQVIANYSHTLKEDGVVIFSKSLRVVLLSDKVGCTCSDIFHRHLPCKHIFAAAALRGDTSALLSDPAFALKSTTVNTQRKRVHLRPQDIQVGRFFLLSDFLFSDTACRYGLVNWFDPETEYGLHVLEGMQMLCDRLLDPLCDEFGRISVTRGYLGEHLYRWLYGEKHADNWKKGALAHGFQEQGGADILVHAWEGTPLELALHIQGKPETYTFDFIRTYSGSSILCVGVGRFKNVRSVMEWGSDFRSSTKHYPKE
jgi:hypothetical protein